MNDAIFKFKRYEDSSLSYTGIDRHEGEDIGGWDTVIKRKEYEALFYNQQSTMAASGASEDDIPEKSYVIEYENYKVAEERTDYKKSAESQKRREIHDYKSPTEPSKPEFVTATFGIKSPIVPPVINNEDKPTVDVSGVVVGATVHHNKFGNGEVVELDSKHITVAFSEGEKRFLFPYVFEQGFLTTRM
jgi:hypothetical protein